MAEWESGDVQGAGVRLRYHRTGGGRQPVLMLHGATDNGLCWSRTARALQGQFDCIMLDARGHGLSGAPPSGYTAEDHAADVAEVIRNLQLGRPVLLGHSMGAATAAATAAHYPDLAGALIMEDPPWRGEPISDPVVMQERAAKWRAGLEKIRAQRWEDSLAWTRRHHPTWTEEDILNATESSRQVNPIIASGIAGRGIRWQDVARSVTCPALLITGDSALGAIVTPNEALEAIGLCQSLRVAHIGGSGHNVRREQFEVFLALMVRFLDGTW